MTRYQSCILLAVSVGLVSLSGATCDNFLSRPPDDLRRLPPALPSNPTLGQIAAALNANTARIQSFSCSQAKLSVAGFPPLQATVAYEQAMRFRLRADTVLGQEVDLGSNDELFWFWVRHNDPPGVYYCRHGEFANSPVRRNLMVDPYLLIEAMGLVRLDPAYKYEGPFVRPDGHLQITMIRDTDRGPTRRVLILDGRQGVVLAQYLYDAAGQVTASATTSRYRQDPISGALMPETIDLHTSATPGSPAFSMRLDLGTVAVNRPVGGSEQLWVMPTFAGYPLVDLCSPGGVPSPTQPPPATTPRTGRLMPPGGSWR